MCSLPPPPDLSQHPVDVGERVEAIIAARLLQLGYSVLTPHGTNHRFDLVVYVGGRFFRAQCKTGRLRRGAVLFATRSTRTNRLELEFRDYRGEVELFLVYCPELDELYAMEPNAVARTAGSLRVDPCGNGQQANVKWARDFRVGDVGTSSPR